MNADIINDYCLNMDNETIQELVNIANNGLGGSHSGLPPNYDISKFRGLCNPRYFPEVYEGVSKNPADYGFGEPEITHYNVPIEEDSTEYIMKCDEAKFKENKRQKEGMQMFQQQISRPSMNNPANSGYADITYPRMTNGYQQQPIYQDQQINNDPYAELANYYGYQPCDNYNQQQMQGMGYYNQQQMYGMTYPQQGMYYQQPIYNNQVIYPNQQMQGMGYYNQQQMYGMTYPQQGMYYQQPQQNFNYNPIMAQQISNVNNNGYYSSYQQPAYNNQSQVQQQNNLLNSQGKPKIQLYYSNGRCYNMDGSDGQFPMDEIGMQINANPHAFDRKLLREEHRNRTRAVIEYAKHKDLGSIFRDDIDDDYILMNPTPDPTKPGFEWDIVDQMRTISERQQMPHDESDEHYYNAMQQMHKEGLISFNRFTANANGGLEHVNDNGYHAYAPNGFKAFGFGGSRFGYYNPYVSQQQEIYENHNKAMARAFKVMQMGLGITDEEVKAADERAQARAIADFYKQQSQMSTEMQQNAFTTYIKQGTQSDEKDYLSPNKYNIIKNHNKVYEERHKHIDPDMSYYDFMCGGGYADIYFEDIKYQNRQKMNNLVRVYDDMFCRNGINQFSAFYDAFNATSPKGVSIKDGELHIEVPPEIAARHYNDRRETFFTKIFNRQNAAILPTDTEFFATQYSAPQFIPNGYNTPQYNNAINPASSGGWSTTGYGQQQYYQNPSGCMRM